MWKITIERSASKVLKKLDRETINLINQYFEIRIIPSKDPSVFAKPLRNDLKGFWRFRIDKIRIICKFDQENKVITIYAVGYRREVYTEHHK